MKNRTIFITYNPSNEEEQILATRLHTIGAVNGFRMYLPDRYNSETILDNETKKRIEQSEWVIMFSLSKSLSTIVLKELEYAYKFLKDKTKIIVLYSTKTGKTVKSTHFTEIFFDPYKESVDEVVQNIMKEIFRREAKDQQIQILKEKNEEKNAFLALLGIGLGLVIIGAIASRR